MVGRDSTVTRVGQQHFHLRIGPEQVDIYGNLNEPYAGPYFDVIYDDALAAGVSWIDTVNHYLPNFLDEEEIEIVLQDLADYADYEHEDDGSGLFIELEQGIIVRIEECWGCVPKHTN